MSEAAIGVRRRAPGPGRWPWLDRGGRVSPLKIAFLAVGALPLLWLLILALTPDGLGSRQLNAATHFTGLWGIRFLLLSLAITPVRYALAWPRIVVVRRQVGLTALAYLLLHVSLFWASLGFNPIDLVTEIATRWYLAVGFVALSGLTVLGVTSTDGWAKRLGRDWKRLHRAVFVLAALGLLHHFMQAKANVGAAAVAAGVFVWLMLFRAVPAERRYAWSTVALLWLAAPLWTAAIEGLWYAAATHVDPARVVGATLHVTGGMRPADWIALAATGAAGAMAVGMRRVG